MKKPRILGRRTLCTTPYFRISRLVADFADHRKTYYVSNRGERAGAILLKGNSVLLVSQYRFLAGRACWEIPGGAVEKRETPAAAAARECREEAGVSCRRLTPLLTFMPGTDTLANRTHLFVGRGIREAPLAPGGEIDRRRWVPFAQCLEWVRRGRIEDGLTVTALLAFRIFGRDASRRRG